MIGKVWLEVAVEGLVTWYGRSARASGRWWMAVGCGELVVVVVVEMDVGAVVVV